MQKEAKNFPVEKIFIILIYYNGLNFDKKMIGKKVLEKPYYCGLVSKLKIGVKKWGHPIFKKNVET